MASDADWAYLGLDLGGTEIKAIALKGDGAVLWEDRTPTGADGPRDAVLDRLQGMVEQALRTLAPAAVTAVGLAVPAVLDMPTGTIELLTNFAADWSGFPITAEMERRTGKKTFSINDVRAATVAEMTWGAGRPYRHFVCLAIGTGIGGGVVVDGDLVLGSRGAAGEVGHQTVDPAGPRCNCGNLGCVEAVAGGYAIARDARAAIEAGDHALALMAGSTRPTPREVAEAARRGNRTAAGILHRAGTMIGLALANTVCVLNPEAVVIGGGVAAAGDLLLQPIRDEIARRTVVFSPRRGGIVVVPSPLGGRAGAMGAAGWAMWQSDARTGA